MTTTDNTFQILNTKCPNLKKLKLAFNFSNGKDVLDSHFKNIRNLESLLLVSPVSLTDEGISHMVKESPNFTEFYVPSCTLLTDLSLRYLGDNCPNLRAMNISNNLNFTDEGIKYLTEKCKKLCLVQFDENTGLTDQSLIYMATNLPLLFTMDINMASFPNISCKGIAAIPLHSPKLTQFKISNGNIDLEVVKNTLMSQSVTDIGWAYARLPKLELSGITSPATKLDLSGECDINDEDLQQLVDTCPNLVEFRIGSKFITDKGLDYVLEKLPNLKIFEGTGSLVVDKQKYVKR